MELIKKPSGNVTLFAFDSGENLSEHTAPFDALVQVIEGVADIRIAEKNFTVAVGQMLLLPAGVPHAVHAPGRFKMILTMIKEK